MPSVVVELQQESVVWPTLSNALLKSKEMKSTSSLAPSEIIDGQNELSFCLSSFP
jgi:hypothetical protein